MTDNAPVILSKLEPMPATPVKLVTAKLNALPPYHCTLSAVRIPMPLPGVIVAPLVMTKPAPPVKIVPAPVMVALLVTTTWPFNRAVPPASWKYAALVPLPTTKLPALL